MANLQLHHRPWNSTLRRRHVNSILKVDLQILGVPTSGGMLHQRTNLCTIPDDFQHAGNLPTIQIRVIFLHKDDICRWDHYTFIVISTGLKYFDLSAEPTNMILVQLYWTLGDIHHLLQLSSLAVTSCPLFTQTVALTIALFGCGLFYLTILGAS